MMFKINDLTKTILLYIARSEIAAKLNINFTSNKYFEKINNHYETNTLLNKKIANFVTLDINDELRGCIGQITPCEVLLKSLKENSISSAFFDTRFYPLSFAEFNFINIEISLLSKLETIEYKDKFDLLSKINEGEDGLLIKKNNKSSTFLPQVWEQLNDKKDFLNHLCLKAQLPVDIWEHELIEVKKYKVMCFNEKNMRLIW